MLTTILIASVILAISVILLAIKIIVKKNGEFPNIHLSGSAALNKKGIHCAKTQDREQAQAKNLYDRLE